MFFLFLAALAAIGSIVTLILGGPIAAILIAIAGLMCVVIRLLDEIRVILEQIRDTQKVKN